MKTTTAALLIAALIGSSIIATTADARGRGGHGGHRGHHHHGHRSHVGVFFGFPGPFFYPGPYYYPSPYYYPRYQYPPVVAAPAGPPVYIEQSAPGAPVQGDETARAYWYFCRDNQTYYPYVQQCPSPWERVVPQGVPQS